MTVGDTTCHAQDWRSGAILQIVAGCVPITLHKWDLSLCQSVTIVTALGLGVEYAVIGPIGSPGLGGHYGHTLPRFR